MAADENLPALPDDTSSLFRRSLENLGAAATGAVREGAKGMLVKAGHVFQAMMQGKFLQQLSEEWEDWKRKGRVKPGHEESKVHASCLRELFEYLDGESLDPDVFDAIKRIFIVAAVDTKVTPDDVLPAQYMRICRGLTSGAILVLGTTRLYGSEDILPEGHGYVLDSFRRQICENARLVHPELVVQYLDELAGKQLVHQSLPTGEDTNQLLTGLGAGLLKFIAAYDRLAADEGPSPDA